MKALVKYLGEDQKRSIINLRPLVHGKIYVANKKKAGEFKKEWDWQCPDEYHLPGHGWYRVTDFEVVNLF